MPRQRLSARRMGGSSLPWPQRDRIVRCWSSSTRRRSTRAGATIRHAGRRGAACGAMRVRKCVWRRASSISRPQTWPRWKRQSTLRSRALIVGERDSMTTIALSLISHTNAGKTTLARTLLGRDVGEVRDAPNVTTEAAAFPLITTDDGDNLVLWDTPGFGDSKRLLRRLAAEGSET